MDELQGMFFDLHKKARLSESLSAGESFEEDIYGDLESSIFTLGKSDKRLRDEDNELKEKLVQARNEVRELQSQNVKLVKENKNYAINAASLYTTAKNEIEKKNFIIKQLQTQLKEIATTKSQLTKAEVEEILKSCHIAHHEASLQITVDEINKAIEQLTAAAKPKPCGYKKQFQFGNMSLYLYREQVPFEKSSESRAGRAVKLDVTSLPFQKPSAATDTGIGDIVQKEQEKLQVDKDEERENLEFGRDTRQRSSRRSRDQEPDKNSQERGSRDDERDKNSRERGKRDSKRNLETRDGERARKSRDDERAKNHKDEVRGTRKDSGRANLSRDGRSREDFAYHGREKRKSWSGTRDEGSEKISRDEGRGRRDSKNFLDTKDDGRAKKPRDEERTMSKKFSGRGTR